MGTNGIEEYDGFLIGVGINYVVLQYYLNNNVQIIDFYGIKSLTVFYEELVRPVYASSTSGTNQTDTQGSMQMAAE